jgi:dsRNA-specific ribonuclease
MSNVVVSNRFLPRSIISFLTIWIVDGQIKGEGTGQNQKQAKELAARQAWMAMGWGTRKSSSSMHLRPYLRH